MAASLLALSSPPSSVWLSDQGEKSPDSKPSLKSSSPYNPAEIHPNKVFTKP